MGHRFFSLLFILFFLSPKLWAFPDCASEIISLVNTFKSDPHVFSENFDVWSLNIGAKSFDLSDFGPRLGHYVLPVTYDELDSLALKFGLPRVLILNTQDESFSYDQVTFYKDLLERLKSSNPHLNLIALGKAADMTLEAYVENTHGPFLGENFSAHSHDDTGFFKTLFFDLGIEENRELKIQILQTFYSLAELRGKNVLCVLTGSSNSLALFIIASYFLGSEHVYAIVPDTGLAERVTHMKLKKILGEISPTLVQTFSFSHAIFSILEDEAFDLKTKKERIFDYYVKETKIRIRELERDHRVKIDMILRPSISSVNLRKKETQITDFSQGSFQAISERGKEKFTERDVRRLLVKLDKHIFKIAKELDVPTKATFKAFNSQGVEELIGIFNH